MSLSNLALILSVITSGLFAGLMLTLVVIMQQMWSKMPASTYITAMQAFLPAAKGNPIIAILTILPIFAPLLALWGNAPESARFSLILIGLVLASAPLLITLRFNFPIYHIMMRWNASHPDTHWQQVQRRFFWLNFSRMIFALAAMICFLLTLIV